MTMLGSETRVGGYGAKPADGRRTVLIVGPEVSERYALRRVLAEQGYRIVRAGDAIHLMGLVQHAGIDLVILDATTAWAWSSCRRLAEAGGPPVILLGADDAEGDRIAALENGADRFLPRRCSARELIANVRRVLHGRPGDKGRRRFAGFTLDVATHEVWDAAGEQVALSPGEFAVLRVFTERPQRVLPRDEILLAARGHDSEAFDRAVDIQVSRLRRKLGRRGREIIKTIRNQGYLFVPRVETCHMRTGS